MNNKIDKSRGAGFSPAGRFLKTHSEFFDDGWPRSDDEPTPAITRLHIDHARSIVSSNQSPDVPFERSINPIAGCEHGCVYCYARPTHAYRDLSPGIDFETELFYKPAAAELLRATFEKPGYQPKTIVIGSNTDPYQPVERKLGITRQLLEVFLQYQHPTGIVTKGSGVLRDLDILSELAKLGLIKIWISLTTLDSELKRKLEPRTASPMMRLKLIHTLREAGIPVGALIAPVIPFINDEELERLVAAAKNAGASEVGYVMLRLPLEVAEIFQHWLKTHYPDRAERVMSVIRNMRSGKDYDSRFGQRMTGQGPYADLIRQRFQLALKSNDLHDKTPMKQRTDLFHIPGRPIQGELAL